MKRAVMVLAVLALIWHVSLRSGQGEDAREGKPRGSKNTDQVKDLMHQKLVRSQDLLEGISVGDFDKIEKNADELLVLSNKAEWMVLQTPRYKMYSDDFRRAAEELGRNARKKNLDAASLSYVEMTLNCVRCHKYVRE